MTYLYKKYRRNKFKEWKQRVNVRLPGIIMAFYMAKMNRVFIPDGKEKKLGLIITDINNPFYTILGYGGERLDANSEMAAEIILEILVNEVFAFVNTKCLITKY